MATPIRFWVNDREVATEASPGLLVLDWLREEERLTGTKEGCKEGDCGACAVLIGELEGDRVRYEPVTSCLVPLGEMHGRHLVTVEGFNPPGLELNVVQQAVVDRGGTQCGFCTPGFIVSMCWYLLGSDEPEPTREGFKRAMSGNLCRCTGYGSLFRASDDLVEAFGLGGRWSHVWQASDRVRALVDEGLLPAYFAEMPERLRAIPPAGDDAPAAGEADFVVSGGTDLYVQQGEALPHGRVRVLNREPGRRGIERVDGALRMGAQTTFEEFAQHPDVQAYIPRIEEFMFLVASLHLRVRSSLAGNLVNASPIGDMTALLLALEAELELAGPEGNRNVPLKSFYRGYKTMDLQPGELVEAIRIPLDPGDTRVNFEKLSKRRCLDIASVNGAMKVRADASGVIEHASLSVGGVAPIPLHASRTSEWLVGKPVTAETVREADRVLQDEIGPIDDVRGSARYKRLLARRFLFAHFTELYPERVSFDELAAPAA